MSRHYLLIAATFDEVRHVRVGAEHLARIDPSVPVTVVVVDEDPRSLRALADVGKLVTGSELGISPGEVGRWAAAYGPKGVRWTAFPHVARAIGSAGDEVVWIGHDLEVVAPPTKIQ